MQVLENPIRRDCHNVILKGTLFNSKPQSLPHLISNLLLVLRSPLAPHLRGLDIRRTLIVRLGEHTHHGDEDLLHALDRRPAFRCVFIVVGIIAWWVENRDTNGAIRVDYQLFVRKDERSRVTKLTIWVPDSASNELHCWRTQGVVLWELELCSKDSALEGCASGAFDQSFPVEHVIL